MQGHLDTFAQRSLHVLNSSIRSCILDRFCTHFYRSLGGVKQGIDRAVPPPVHVKQEAKAWCNVWQNRPHSIAAPYMISAPC